MASEGDLSDAKAALDASTYKIFLEEVDYDEKCLNVYLKNINNFKVRVAHQRDDWAKKRLDRAKTAVDQWWRAKVGENLLKSWVLTCS